VGASTITRLGFVALLASCAADGTLAVATVVYTRPPAIRVEPVVERPGFMWVQGRWTFSHGAWVWVPGHLEKQRSGYVLEGGRWEQRGNAWYWVDGRWITGSTETAGHAAPVAVRAVAPSVYPTVAPPPVRVESVARGRAGFVWVPGNWEWRAGSWAWIDGHWLKQEPDKVWVPARWELQGSYYVKLEGHWELRSR
jgi:hypothetical protein